VLVAVAASADASSTDTTGALLTFNDLAGLVVKEITQA